MRSSSLSESDEDEDDDLVMVRFPVLFAALVFFFLLVPLASHSPSDPEEVSESVNTFPFLGPELSVGESSFFAFFFKLVSNSYKYKRNVRQGL